MAENPVSFLHWNAAEDEERAERLRTAGYAVACLPFSGVKSDLSQQAVRRTAEGAGLVDYKIIAIDETWSGLLFTRRTGGPKPQAAGAAARLPGGD